MPDLDLRSLAAIDATTLVRSLAVALVLVTPYFVSKWRRVRRIRRAAAAALAAAEAPPAPTPGTTLEDVVATVEEAAAKVQSGEPGIFVEIRQDVTVDGRPAAPGIVEAVVRDTLRRNGLVATAELDRGPVRLLELRAAPTRS